MYFETPPENREPAIRTMAMPKDTNGLGDIFGGWLMAHADMAGAVLGFQRARGRVVTVSVNEFTFLRPVYVGDVVSFYTDVNKVGRTSVAIDITMFSMRNTDGREEQVRVATARITYVHIGADRLPRAIPAD